MKAILIDESRDDLRIADRLSRAGLDCDAIQPDADMSDLQASLSVPLGQGKYDAVLVDFRLDEETNDEGRRPNYRGGSVAAWLKETFPNLPVVLVTTEAKLQEWLAHNPTVRMLFDLEVMKRDLASPTNRRLAAVEITDLASGFKAIAEALTRNRGMILGVFERAMHATESEAKQLEAMLSGGQAVSTIELARWLLTQALAFPGLLLPQEEVRVRLGLTNAGIGRKEVQELLSVASYDGVFSVLRPRWWRSRLEGLLSQAKEDRDIASSVERAKLVSELAGVSLRPGKCVWCGGDLIVRACYLCEESADSAHCLPAKVDERPGWAETAVVCFSCIETGRADGVAFPGGSDAVASRVRSGKVSKDAVKAR